MPQSDTYHVRALQGNPAVGPGPALCRRNLCARCSAPGLAGPRAPVTAGRDEVPVGGRCLRDGGRAVPEDAGARSSPSGTAPGTGRSGRPSGTPTRTARRREPLRSGRRRRGRSPASGLPPRRLRAVAPWRRARERRTSGGRLALRRCEARRVEAELALRLDGEARVLLEPARASRGSGAPADPSSSCSGGASAAHRGARPTGTAAVAGRANRIRAHAPIARAFRSDLHLGDRAHGAARKAARSCLSATGTVATDAQAGGDTLTKS